MMATSATTTPARSTQPLTPRYYTTTDSIDECNAVLSLIGEATF